jgi:hypothetical protein
MAARFASRTIRLPTRHDGPPAAGRAVLDKKWFGYVARFTT